MTVNFPIKFLSLVLAVEAADGIKFGEK